MARIRVTRVLVYEGERDWVYQSLEPEKTLVSPDKVFQAGRGTITETERKEEEVDATSEWSSPEHGPYAE